MKYPKIELLKDIVEQMWNARTDKSRPMPVIQRVSANSQNKRVVQIITTTGMLTFQDTVDLNPEEALMLDIGHPDKWNKAAKHGVISSSDTFDVPFQRAAAVSALADSEAGTVEYLLRENVALPPVDPMMHPGDVCVFSKNGGKSLDWAFRTDSANSAERFLNLCSEWTANPLECPDDMYGCIPGWHRAVANLLPKDSETGQLKVDGVAFGGLGQTAALRIVIKPMGMVLTLCCTYVPTKEEGQTVTVSYTDRGGRLVEVECSGRGKYTNKEGEDMKAKLKTIDIGALMVSEDKTVAEPAADVEPEVRAEPSEVIPTPPEESALSTINVPEESPADTQDAAQTPAEVKSEAQEEPSVDDLTNILIGYFDAQILECRENKQRLRQLLKRYKADVREAKSNAKALESLAKAQDKIKQLKAMLGKAYAMATDTAEE